MIREDKGQVVGCIGVKSVEPNDSLDFQSEGKLGDHE